MFKKSEIYAPFFTATEKQLIYDALEEAGDNIRRFYCFSPREWFNHCYDLQTEGEGTPEPNRVRAFAEVKQYVPLNRSGASLPGNRYTICLFDHNILQALWKRSNLGFYPFLLYILTHELIHVARFCQDFHPFDSDEASCQEEEDKVTRLTQKILDPERNWVLATSGLLFKPMGTSLSPRPEPDLVLS